MRLGEALPSFDVVSTIGILHDQPPEIADLYAALEMVANTRKPLVILISDESLFPAVLDLLETCTATSPPGLLSCPTSTRLRR